MPKDRVDNMSDRTYTKGVLKVEIVFYKFADGTCPVKDFIRSLDVKMKAKTLKTIELLENSGTALREPYSKSLVMEYSNCVSSRVLILQEFCISFMLETQQY